MHLNFALTWWDSFICDCICQKNMIKKLARDHVFAFKTLSFYCAFVRTFRALFAFFAFLASFAFCQSRLRHRAFFSLSCPRYFCFSCPRYFCLSCLSYFCLSCPSYFCLVCLVSCCGRGRDNFTIV